MKLRRLANAGTAASILLIAISTRAQGGDLVRAEYGIEGNRVDVTRRVRSLLRQGRLHFEVSNENLGVDPDPHRRKDLVIRVRHWDGDSRDYRFPEKSLVELELDPDEGYQREEGRGLRILRAFYGAEGSFVNVTQLLERRVDDGKLHMHINNDSMGGDPAPRVHKQLRVLYLYDGQRRNALVPESGDLRLP
jgi:hypothetical protein